MLENRLRSKNPIDRTESSELSCCQVGLTTWESDQPFGSVLIIQKRLRVGLGRCLFFLFLDIQRNKRQPKAGPLGGVFASRAHSTVTIVDSWCPDRPTNLPAQGGRTTAKAGTTGAPANRVLGYWHTQPEGEPSEQGQRTAAKSRPQPDHRYRCRRCNRKALGYCDLAGDTSRNRGE